MQLQMIAFDLDGTILNSRKELTARTLAALAAAHAAGIIFVVATGRQFASLPATFPVEDFDFAVTSNGAIGFDYSNERVLFVEQVSPASQKQVVDYLLEKAPGTLFGATRDLGDTFVTQPEYLKVMTERELLHDRRKFVLMDLAEICAEPTVKFVARHEQISPEVLREYLEESGIAEIHATTSGAAFVEIGAATVTKAKGVAWIADSLEIPKEQVAAIGDANNDVEMLTWAGLGIAVANAAPEVFEVAQMVIPGNDEDGVAQFLEALLVGARSPSGRSRQ
ncbi:MAG: Cof-type HAD-IIB family hydrolase [Propionibacteriaceae bacterium]|nr:Cof-type HAD-IIB family hydrolase [Propionibacteriaceae bacterium]